MSNSNTKLLSKPYSTEEKALMEEATTLMDKLEKVCLKLEAPLFISMVTDSKPESTSYTTKILSAALLN